MSDHGYYQKAGKACGPWSPDQLKSLVTDGTITASTLIRRGKDGDWIEAGGLKGLFPKSTVDEDSVADEFDGIEIEKDGTRLNEFNDDDILSTLSEPKQAKPKPPDRIPCPFCGEPILGIARKCKHCGEFFDDRLANARRPVIQQVQPRGPNWNRGFAALWSLFIPGAGHFYKGNVIEGIGWLVLTPVSLLLWPVFGVILYLLCIMSAASGDTNKT